MRKMAAWSLAATAACLPVYVVRFRIGPLPSTLLEMMIGLTVVLYLLTLRAEHRLPMARTPFDIPIILLLAGGMIGAFVAPDHTRALGIYRAYFIEAIVVFYIAVDLIRSEADLFRFLVVAGAGDCLFAVGQVVTFGVALAHGSLHIDAGPAFLNTSANDIALYLEPPFAFAIGMAVFLSSMRSRMMAVACALLFLVGIVLSLSRAGYLAVAIFAVITVISLPGWRFKAWAAAGLACVALAVLELPFIGQRLGTLAHSSALRVSIYSEALRMLAQRPILGAGISGFPIRVAPFRPGTEEIELYPHNLWLTTWSEIGLLGVAAFAMIFFGLMVRGVRALRTATGLNRAVIWGSVGALVLYLVHGMFDSPYWKNDLSVEFWLIAAMQVVAVRARA